MIGQRLVVLIDVDLDQTFIHPTIRSHLRSQPKSRRQSEGFVEATYANQTSHSSSQEHVGEPQAVQRYSFTTASLGHQTDQAQV
jgi:hypothetical protein